MDTTVRVKGLRQLRSNLKRYDRELNTKLDQRLQDAAQIVATGARERFTDIDARSAAGFRPRLRGFGKVVVEQRLRKKTGLRPDYGALQMRRALLPALAANEEKIMAALEDMLDDLARRDFD